MANKVIEIGTEQTQDFENDEIYVDIDMNSILRDNTITKEPELRINKSVNVRAVQNSLDNIFTWIPGERIINPEFGSNLRKYLYEGITDFNTEKIVAEIKYSVQKFDDRVQVKEIRNISKIEDTEDNTIVLDIIYSIRDLPDQIFHKQYEFNKENS